MSFNIPILLLTFNRLDTTVRVFEKIKQLKPKYLFIASDGPRSDKPGEAQKVEAVKNYIFSQIDWDCEIKTLFRKKNLGCGRAVSEAITWFFESVDKGIILEDDCLPHPDFFTFCKEALDYYDNDARVLSVSGTNLQGGVQRGDGSYYFSNYGGIWGWATWARVWKNYDFEMKNLDSFLETGSLRKIFSDRKQQRFWTEILKRAKHIDTWDYQWHQMTWTYGGIHIVPNFNLIENIGFSNDGTHTANKPYWYDRLTNLNAKVQLKNIVHPEYIGINTKADDFLFEKCYKPISLYTRVCLFLKKRITKLL
ncbi:nucleotide-diphospho-sugar transferase [Mucilaginibacter lappiensis]|uniref:Nucleotide-diphospho-sugar transferase n=1 Tax=Mucilaginibacter lappiensis TaxID=354630 RepID=A0A841JG81_9SPHI|nr:nucleotide-diphospho-sugar transferase [Mucilaginibacter lappiensis]MBB6127041.1 hypothetical protein [Mucilaginibacter lappiensis]